MTMMNCCDNDSGLAEKFCVAKNESCVRVVCFIDLLTVFFCSKR
jgi:hypothetical protein